MTIFRRLLSLAGMTTALAMTGCAFPLGGSPHPQAAHGRPMMGPTASFTPAGPQSFNGPVAYGPAPVLTMNSIAPQSSASLSPTPLASGTATASTAPATAAPTAARPSNGTITYFNVRPGDTVTSIATLYGVPETELRQTNNLKNSDQVAPGQLVRIPDGATAIR